MSLAMHYAVKRRNMAKGGDVKGVNMPAYSGEKGKELGHSEAGNDVRSMRYSNRSPHDPVASAAAAKEKHGQVLGELKSMAGQDRTNLAEGGCVKCATGSCMAHGGDVVDRIMARMSEGGEIANGGETNEADQAPAEFDDLALRDGLEFHDTGASSGDEDGSPAADMDDDDDIVSRIMKKMRQTMPRTGSPGYPE